MEVDSTSLWDKWIVAGKEFHFIDEHGMVITKDGNTDISRKTVNSMLQELRNIMDNEELGKVREIQDPVGSYVWQHLGSQPKDSKQGIDNSFH